MAFRHGVVIALAACSGGAHPSVHEASHGGSVLAFTHG